MDKLSDLASAIADLVRNEDSVVVGACLESNIPFCAVYELIRQGKHGLDMIAPISDTATDILIGAGCVAGITGAWVGNTSAGLGHNYRRAAEKGLPHPIRIRDYSNFTLAAALMAGAYGFPYLPVRSILGSDILESNPGFKQATNPFAANREPIVLVPPLKSDVAILAVQRCDRAGNCHLWGNSGVTTEAAIGAKRIIVVADEIVEPSVIASDPSRVPFPGWQVTAVCHVPAGCHPSPVTGLWRRDTGFFTEYHQRSREPAEFQAWLNEWVLSVPDHAAYRAKLAAKLAELRIKGWAPSAPANYASD
jgi:glutaconate CoA-transferase, subunit A